MYVFSTNNDTLTQLHYIEPYAGINNYNAVKVITKLNDNRFAVGIVNIGVRFATINKDY